MLLWHCDTLRNDMTGSADYGLALGAEVDNAARET